MSRSRSGLPCIAHKNPLSDASMSAPAAISISTMSWTENCPYLSQTAAFKPARACHHRRISRAPMRHAPKAATIATRSRNPFPSSTQASSPPYMGSRPRLRFTSNRCLPQRRPSRFVRFADALAPAASARRSASTSKSSYCCMDRRSSWRCSLPCAERHRHTIRVRVRHHTRCMQGR